MSKVTKENTKRFVGKEAMEDLAKDIKLSTIKFQETNNKRCLYFQLAARPRLTNESSSHNQVMVRAYCDAKEEIHSEGCQKNIFYWTHQRCCFHGSTTDPTVSHQFYELFDQVQQSY